MVERFHRTLEAMCYKFVDDCENQKDWDFYLPLVMMVYCPSVHESTCFSPNGILLGREALLPPHLVTGQREPTENNTSEYAAKLCEHMERLHQFAGQHVKLIATRGLTMITTP